MHRLYPILISVISITFLSSCDGVPPYDAAAQEGAAVADPGVSFFTENINGQNLHGVISTPICTLEPTAPAVVFIHGAPGDWRAWGDYLADPELTAHAALIALDRPGFGQSDGGTPILALEDQARIITEGVKSVHPGPFILVGHSYGGPVQLEIAQDYPTDVAGHVVLAGAVDPVLQASRWYHYLADTMLGRYVLNTELDVTTQEMLALPAELEAQAARLGEITGPVTIVQGTEDWLVPQGNEVYLEANLTHADVNIVLIPDQGHFLPWEQYDLVKQEILSLLPDSPC